MEKKPRPRVLGGITVKVPTACGNMYVQMNWKDGKLFEVFATLGHSGGCASSQSEALTRSITLGMRCGVPYDEYVKQLREIRCPNPLPFPKKFAVFSCPDALGKVLAEFGSMGPEGVIDLIKGVEIAVLSTDKEEAAAVVEMHKLAETRKEQGL